MCWVQGVKDSKAKRKERIVYDEENKKNKNKNKKIQEKKD